MLLEGGMVFNDYSSLLLGKIVVYYLNGKNVGA